MVKNFKIKRIFWSYVITGILVSVFIFAVKHNENFIVNSLENKNAAYAEKQVIKNNSITQKDKFEEDEFYDVRETIENRGVKPEPLSQSEYEQKWREVLSMPSENDFGDAPVTSWKCIGPYGMRVGQNDVYYSGRVLGIEVEGVPSTRIGTASGGLWRYELIFPVPMTESATSQVIGAFATSPADPSKVIIGTGEPYGSGGYGTGLFKTTDGGATWVSKTISPSPAFFYKIKYRNISGGIVHAASNTGYYRSDNSGESWVLRFSGEITDLDFSPSTPNIMYISKTGDGIYKSISGGTSWFKLTSFPAIPDSIGRASISVSKSNPDYIYVALAGPSGATVGIYRTTNQGLTWHDISYKNSSGVVINYHSNGITNQGKYNNCIGVSPANPNLVLAGGVILIRTTNGGTNWNEVTEIMHTDHHVIRWHSDGIRVWEGNDGGLAYSGDYGETFSSNANLLPITQFYNFDIGISGTNIIAAGGTQDNAFPVSNDCSVNGPGAWNKCLGADASSSKVDKFNPQRMMGLTFNSGNTLNKTIDGGLNWAACMTGLDYATPISNIEDGGAAPINCYIGYGNKIYYSTNFGDSWQQFTNEVFPSIVWRVNVSKFGPSGNIIYAIIYTSPPDPGNILRVYDSGVWYDRSAGLPLAPLRYVAQHPSNDSIAYALTDGYYSAQKIFRTTNRGINWTNITGNLPNIPMADLVVHPANNNVLFAGSVGYGVFKSTNGGTNWFSWTNGMPIANQIERLKVIDSTSATGRFYVVAASHGRGIWVREGSGDDPLNISIIVAKMDDLRHHVDSLVSSGKLASNFGKVLNNHISGAKNQLNHGHPLVAIIRMELFNFEVYLLIQHQFLSGQFGQPLISVGNEIISSIRILYGNGNSVQQLNTDPAFSLGQNYPNPFNPLTKIKFEIPYNGFVTLKIYDILGREAASVLNENLTAGLHEAVWNASNYSTGIYFYKLVLEYNGQRFEKTMKMMLIK